MKKTSLLLICIFTCLNAFSGVVSEEQALQKAQRFMQGKLFGQRKTLRRAPSVVNNNAYYIFNADNKNGFVIVSGDDRTVEILGYSDYGQLNEDDMPENLKIWLQGYQEQIASLRNNKPRKSSSNQRPAIDELIQTRWNQRWPYNTMCPMDGDNQCVTGCVATAMAQIMYYHRWPETYDWDNMLLDYLGESTKEQQNAVAKLMSDCGVAVDMNYSATASGANLTPECLKDIFGYSQTARFISHDDYTNSTWEDIIYEELAEGRPVYYRGAKEVCTASFNLTYVGHAFICDGYDGHGLFHINWGWGGMSNGYFVLSIADPSESGIGGSDAEGGYSFGQAAIIGIQPDNGIVSLPYVAASNYTCTPRVYNRTSSSKSFTDVNLSALFNCYKTDFSGLLGFGLFKGSTLLEVLEGASECSLKINEKKQHSINTSFGAGLDDGKYYIRAIYKVDGSQEWSVCREFNYLSATIDGLSLTINELDKTTQKLKINSVVIDGEKKEGRLLTTLINITNEGETSVQNIKIAIGSTFITVPANLEPGETSDIKAEIRLKDNGEQNIVITCDGNQLWTEQLTIEECPEYDFSGTVTVDGMVMGRLWHQGFINGNTVKGTLTLTNNSNVPYDDDVIVRLSSKFPLREQLIHVVLGPGETKSFNYEISDLVNADYSFDILYYSRNGNEYLGGYLKQFTQDNTYLPILLVGFDYFYDLSGSYTIKGLDVTNRSDDGTMVNGTIPYTTVEGTLSITNNSSRVFDDDIVLSFGQSEEYPNYSHNDTYHLKLAPGATTEIEFKYDNLEWVDKETYDLMANYNALSGNNTDVNGKNGLASAYIKMFKNFALESNFIMKSHVANEKKNYLKDNKLKFSIEVTNPHSYVFDKEILTSIILYKRETNSSKILNDDRQVEILPKGKITLDYEFDIDDNYYVETSSGYLADELNMGSLAGGRWQFVDDSYIELGDINADGSVDVADLEPLMDLIARNPEDHASNEPAYLFTKTTWDYSVADVVVLLSKINGQMLMGEDYGRSFTDYIKVENSKVRTDIDNVIPVKIFTEQKNYSAFQFDLSVSDGMHVKNDINGIPMIQFSNKRDTDHKVYCRWMENTNSYFVLVYSPTNQPFEGSGDVANITIEVDPDFIQGSVQIDNQHFVEVTDDAVNCYYNYMKYSTFEVAKPVLVKANNYNIKYGDELPTFGYTVEGGALEGTPEITCPATAISPVGTYPITISKGSVTNDYVTYVAGTLTIRKAPLNIAAGTYTKKQGEAMPEFTLTYTGFKNSETKDVLTKQPVVSCSATEASIPGEYAVTISGAEAQNYDISYTNGKLIVVDADAVIVKAKNYSREYGEANPIFEYTVEGAELQGEPVITCQATATSPVGTYDIVVSQGTVTNYNVTYVAGTLTITKAPLTVSVENATREQGQENPEFIIHYSGWKNGEDESVLTTKPTATTEATVDSPVGTYTIVVSGGEAQNYQLSYNNGILSVTKSTGIMGISVEHPADVYDMQGNKVRSNAMSLKGLAKGVYIVNGTKMVVK